MSLMGCFGEVEVMRSRFNIVLAYANLVSPLVSQGGLKAVSSHAEGEQKGRVGLSLQVFLGRLALHRQLKFASELAVCKGWEGCWRGSRSLQ